MKGNAYFVRIQAAFIVPALMFSLILAGCASTPEPEIPDSAADSALVSITSGWYHNLAIAEDGSLWAWGWNFFGQLGNGTRENNLAPARVGTDTNWAFVSAGTNHSAAIRTDGTLWTWGSNFFGQLGDGTTENRHVPTQIGTETDWATVAVGNGHTLAIKRDGTLWSWGLNTSGQLGNGTTGRHNNIPAQAATVNTWALASAGHGRSKAVATDGSLWIWGANWDGWFRENILDPTRIGTDTNWAETHAGMGILVLQSFVGLVPGLQHSVATRTDGTIWSTGSNYSGQFGNDTHSILPAWLPHTQTGTDTDWASVAVGSEFTAAVKENGSLWIWGNIRPYFLSQRN